MPRLHFTCAYDGSPFCGWQSQVGGNSVQDCIEAGFARILGENVRIASSGRTDAGVHARAQHFHVDIPQSCRIPLERWVAALNAQLPSSIRVFEVEQVADDFHTRFCAQQKTYEYVLECNPVCSPFWSGRAWHLPHPQRLDLLAAALQEFVGEHDFRMFAARRGNEPEVPPADYYVRHIFKVELMPQEQGGILRLRLTGNGFMYRMVRLIVGTAQRVASERMSLEELHEMINAPSHTEKTRFCAPACGLYLDEVCY